MLKSTVLSMLKLFFLSKLFYMLPISEGISPIFLKYWKILLVFFKKETSENSLSVPFFSIASWEGFVKIAVFCL